MGPTSKPEHGPARAVNGVTRRLADTSAAQARLGLPRRDQSAQRADGPRRMVAAGAGGGCPRMSAQQSASRSCCQCSARRRRRPRPRRSGPAGWPRVPGWPSSSGAFAGHRRRRARHRSELLHHRSAPGPDRGRCRAGRRGHRAVAVVHRDGKRGPLRRRHTCLRRCRPRHRQPHRGHDRRGPHVADPGDHRGAPGGRAVRRAGPARLRPGTGASRWWRTRPAPPAPPRMGSRSVSARSSSAWSFHPRKVITTGEGGMITTDDSEWATRLRRLREHGMNVSAADRHASAQPVMEAYLETGYNYRHDRHPGRRRSGAAWPARRPGGPASCAGGPLPPVACRRSTISTRSGTRHTARRTSSRSGCCSARASGPAATNCSPSSPRPASRPAEASWPRTWSRRTATPRPGRRCR